MPTNRASIDGLMTVSEIAQERGVSESSVWVWLRNSGVKRYTVPGQGRTTYVKRSDIERYLDAGYARPTERVSQQA